MSVRMTLCLVATAAVCFAAQPTVLTTGSALSIQVQGPEPVMDSAAGPMVRGEITISPFPLKPVCDRLVFYVDDEMRLATDAPAPSLVLDTTVLPDGDHALRLEAERDGQLFCSSGSVKIRVANTEGSAVMDSFLQVPEQAPPPFEKLYRARLTHEAIWFDGQEGDLERHAFISRDRMYVTLTDLLRHIGGQLIWGPKSSYIEVHRNDITLRVTPGSRTVRVNNNAVDIRNPVVVRGGRTYVPARAICDLLGVTIEYNKEEGRAYVYAPQPGYEIQRREYPWISPVTGDALRERPGLVSFRNHTGLPVHVRLQGNGITVDWQIRAMTTLSRMPMLPGTYKVTVWSRQGADYEDYLTVAAGVDDTYDISVHQITLQSH